MISFEDLKYLYAVDPYVYCDESDILLGLQRSLVGVVEQFIFNEDENISSQFILNSFGELETCYRIYMIFLQ